MAAFDTVQNLLDGNRICRLLLRFAYFQLTWVVDAYKAVVAKERVQNKACRPVGKGDATVAINLYLEAKRKVSGVALRRSRLLGHCRTGRRWAALAGRAPLLILVFPHIADTIVYVLSHLPWLRLMISKGRTTPLQTRPFKRSKLGWTNIVQTLSES